MGIEKIKGKVESLSGQQVQDGKALKNRAYLKRPNDSVNFTSLGATAPKTLKDVILGLMPGRINFMVKAHKWMGEIQNQSINALGTGLIAPIFIKYNPLSDTDKDTRTYTAWRQPVSAVLAMATQCAIVFPFDHMIQRMSDEGYEHLALKNNGSFYPSEKYMENLVKAQNKGVKLSKNDKKIKLEEIKNQYNDELRKMINEDRIVFKKLGVNGETTAELPKEDFKNLFEETIDVLIQEEKGELTKALEENQKHKIKRAKFFFEHPEESRGVLNKLADKLTEIYGQAPQGFDNEVGSVSKTACKDFNAACDSIIKDLKLEYKKNPSLKDINKELINMVKEVRKHNINDSSTSRVLAAKIRKMQVKLGEMSGKSSLTEVNQAIINDTNARVKSIEEFIEVLSEIKNKINTDGLTVSQAQKILDEKRIAAEIRDGIKAAEENVEVGTVKNRNKDIESVATRIKDKINCVADRIGDQMKQHVKANIEGTKRWTGLFVSLAILPVTCWLLNRIYPWFMAKAFPNLSNAKSKPKEETVDANKKVEVA